MGRSLSPGQSREVSGLSSHISVTADSAEVTYHWGDFKHDPQVVLARYFDIFLYEANWGTQRVGFRFDQDTVDTDLLAGFAVGEILQVKEAEGQVMVEVWYDENWITPSYSYFDQYEGDWRLEAFESIYCQIQRGDYRGLFLLWLKACELSPEGGETTALPKGMAKLEDEHRILVDFVGVDERLVRQAAERSLPLPRKRNVEKSLDRYLPQLPLDRKEEYVRRLVVEDAQAVQGALRRELRKLGNHRMPNYLGETVCYQELKEAARREAQREEQRAKEKKERRRKEYLAELAEREDELLDRVHELVSGKKAKSYDEAVLLLRGLEDLWVSRGDREHFLKAVECIASEFPRLFGFRGRLEIAGWLEPVKRTEAIQRQSERWRELNPLEREINFDLL